MEASPTKLLSFLILLLSSFNLSSCQCDPNDKRVLLQIKTHFGTNGNLLGWDPTSDCCIDWPGVRCDDSYSRTRGRVTRLSLKFSPNIVYVIPPAVGDLPFLRSLKISLYDNKLIGPIPAAISKLTNLESLDLSGNNLDGAVPGFLSQLTQLTYLDLSVNRFCCALPLNLGKITSLGTLKLNQNQISGLIPATLGDLQNLLELDLSSNILSGSIPDSLADLTQLTRLDLRANRLTGSVPRSFGAFRNPKLKLYLSQNQLSGPVPRAVGSADVALLDLSSNKLTGDASFLFNNNRTFRTLYLDQNQFEFDFSNVEFPWRMRNLDISNNKINGSLPSYMGIIPFNVLDVSNNQLCGKIPNGLSRFSPDVFSNNKCLCGSPLPPCRVHRRNQSNIPQVA